MPSMIEEWVGNDLKRQAVYTILLAVASDDDLKKTLIMKGGMLLSMRYRSERYTDDVDFSNGMILSDENLDELCAALDEGLAISSAQSQYSVVCWVQSKEVRPKVQGTFPTVQLKVGYGDRTNDRDKKAISSRKSSKVIKMDCSYNEVLCRNEIIEISDGFEISAYSIFDILGEKFRAVLQQLVRKHSSREQDIYDIFYILKNYEPFGPNEREAVLSSLVAKSKGRDIVHLLKPEVLQGDEIREVSQKGYNKLGDLVTNLPPFDVAYEEVRIFFESLPWDKVGDTIVVPD